jgi:NADP-dependent 3-hydroxy acid dehydrogenase YdfG
LCPWDDAANRQVEGGLLQLMGDEGVGLAPAAQVCVVTGAASGIGAATAIELARLGGRVVICDLPGIDVSAVSHAVEGAGGEPFVHPVDIRDFAALQDLVRTIVADHGSLDVLIANAGLEEQSTIVEGDPAEWQRVIDTNLLGTAQTVRAFLPEMIERDSGDIVVMGSISGRETRAGNPVYASTKWGLVGFTRALRQELDARRSRVRLTIIDPGLVDTPLARSVPALQKRLTGGCALLPQDVARLVSFVVVQPRHVLLPELRIEPVVSDVPSSLPRKVGNRIVGLLES